MTIGEKIEPNPIMLLARKMVNPVLRQQWQADRKEG